MTHKLMMLILRHLLTFSSASARPDGKHWPGGDGGGRGGDGGTLKNMKGFSSFLLIDSNIFRAARIIRVNVITMWWGTSVDMWVSGGECCDQSQSSVSQHEELATRLYSCLASSPASPSPRSNFGCRVTASNQSTIAESNIHISCLFYVVMIMYSSRIVLGCPTIYPRINVSLRRILLSLLLTLCWVISITTAIISF